MVTLLTRRGAEGHAGEMPSAPDPEVSEQANRRRFPAAYKARILAAADACCESAQIGVLLRREGLYSSHLSRWRRQRQADTLAPQRRGHQGCCEDIGVDGVDVNASSSRALAQSDQSGFDRFKRGLRAVMHTEF